MRTGLETVAALVWWQCGLVQSAEKIKNQRGPPAHTFRSVISSFLLPRPPFSPCEDEVLCLRFVLPTKVARGTFFSGQLCAAKDHVVDSRQDPSREAQGAHPPVALAPVARARVLHMLAVVHCTRSLRSWQRRLCTLSWLRTLTPPPDCTTPAHSDPFPPHPQGRRGSYHAGTV